LSTQLSKHFKRSEFACYCGCGKNTVDFELINALEALHEELTRMAEGTIRIAITPKGGNRCLAANAAAGGAHDSQHLYSKAADIHADELDGDRWIRIKPEVVAETADRLNLFGGIGRYVTFTHVDVRTGLARWQG